MKIRQIRKKYEEVIKLRHADHKKPVKPSRILSALIRVLSAGELRKVSFTHTEERMELAGDGPWLVLMNHSSFLDLKIASGLLYPKLFQIVCTSDGLVGKEWLMRHIGCIPTQKFVSDISLISDIQYALTENHASVLMYPEASYSFDGTATPLPRKMGILFKCLNVPVVMITTYGSFARDPLYNNLQKRSVKVSAKMECLLTPEEIAEKSVEEIDRILDQAFSFDYFRWQAENGVEITEKFRADGLDKILFKCPHCQCEGKMVGKGTTCVCENCGAEYELEPLGDLKNLRGKSRFTRIPDWYRWEREEVRKDLLSGSYVLDTECEIGMLVDFKAVYMIGHGTLHHDANGFVLDSSDGKLHYEQSPTASYSLYSDYFWYEISDVICIGNADCLYYCFPKKEGVVAKTRLAAEELYKMKKEEGKRRIKSR